LEAASRQRADSQTDGAIIIIVLLLVVVTDVELVKRRMHRYGEAELTVDLRVMLQFDRRSDCGADDRCSCCRGGLLVLQPAAISIVGEYTGQSSAQLDWRLAVENWGCCAAKPLRPTSILVTLEAIQSPKGNHSTNRKKIAH